MKTGVMFPSNYLKASDCMTDRTLEIQEVVMHTLKARDGTEELKPLLSFRGEPKGLILNKTNTRLIEKALGSDDTDDWLGRSITIYCADVEFGGDIVDAIRVRGKAPKAGELGEDDIEF